MLSRHDLIQNDYSNELRMVACAETIRSHVVFHTETSTCVRNGYNFQCNKEILRNRSITWPVSLNSLQVMSCSKRYELRERIPHTWGITGLVIGPSRGHRDWGHREAMRPMLKITSVRAAKSQNKLKVIIMVRKDSLSYLVFYWLWSTIREKASLRSTATTVDGNVTLKCNMALS